MMSRVALRPIALFLLLVALAGCAGRAMVVLVPDAGRVGTSETVLVASTRVFESGEWGNDRLEGLSFVGFDVNIPPDRDPGEISPVRERDRTPDPAEQFMVTRAEGLGEGAGFRDVLRRELAARPAEQREVMVFVHGFNNSFADGLYRTAQIRHDFDVPGVAVHYAWPSAANPLGYAYDRDSALFARDGLEQLLREIAATEGSHEIVLMAHSLGSNVAMEAMRQLRIGGRQNVLDRIGGVILMSPDIDVDVFRSQALRIDPLPQPFMIFTSQRDRALRISATITGQRARLGNIGEVEDVADLNVTLVDVTEFRGGVRDGLNHFTAATSPAMIQLLSQVAQVNLSLEGNAAQDIGLLPGTVLTVRNATQVILSPLTQALP
jgi:esterase/lipase superfamily enzyme